VQPGRVVLEVIDVGQQPLGDAPGEVKMFELVGIEAPDLQKRKSQDERDRDEPDDRYHGEPAHHGM